MLLPSWLRVFVAVLACGTFGAPLAGCGGSKVPPARPAAKLEQVPGSSSSRIVLTALGAQRLGLQTVRARAVPVPRPAPRRRHGRARRPTPVPRPRVIVPYSAIIYAASGKTYVFAQTARLTYVEVPVVVDYVLGSTAYLFGGPNPGTEVVSVGAEELWGVQTGVLSQT